MQRRINNTVFLRHPYSLQALRAILTLLKDVLRKPACICLVAFSMTLLRFVNVHAEGNEAAVVSHVIDGDSLEIVEGGRSRQIRLWGIDTPEYDQDFAEKAKNYTRKMVEGKTVFFSRKYVDRFNRLVVMAWVDGSLLNEELVREGLAWVHVRYCDEDICLSWREFEQEARKQRIGLWGNERPIPPWQWKSRQRTGGIRRD